MNATHTAWLFLPPSLRALWAGALVWLLAPLAAHGQCDLLDLIVVVDTSGSMDEETAEAQQALPGLVQVFAARGFETRLVLIADEPNGTSGICLPAPLGSGSCPGDENLPGYRHVVQAVGSTSALSDLLATHSLFSTTLRDGAHRSILVVSDDNSDMSAAEFSSQLLTLPGFDDFRFHAAALATESFPPLPPDPGICWRNGQAGTQGTVYLGLVTQRGGYFHDFCLAEDLDPSWDPLALTVAIFVDSFDSGGTEDWSAVLP
jgi:hypothetical protein